MVCDVVVSIEGQSRPSVNLTAAILFPLHSRADGKPPTTWPNGLTPTPHLCLEMKTLAFCDIHSRTGEEDRKTSLPRICDSKVHPFLKVWGAGVYVCGVGMCMCVWCACVSVWCGCGMCVSV